MQHKMAEAKKELYEDLIEKNGYFYLCGQAGQLEIDVRNALLDSFKEGGNMSKKEAEEKFKTFDDEGRYCLELY